MNGKGFAALVALRDELIAEERMLLDITRRVMIADRRNTDRRVIERVCTDDEFWQRATAGCTPIR